MEPGLYEGIPAQEYHDSEGISKSGLDLIRRSGIHYWDRYGRRQAARTAADAGYTLDAEEVAEGIQREPDSTVLGRAFHCRVLEPHLYGSEFAVMPHFQGRGSTAAKEGWLAGAEGRTVIRHEDSIRVDAMARAIERKREKLSGTVAGRILDDDCQREISAYWIDPATGVLCRSRMDIFAPGLSGGVIGDLKSCLDASPEAFQRSIMRWRYHVQAAYYIDGCAALGIRIKSFVLFAVESRPPFEVAIYRLSPETIDIGRKEYRKDLAKYASHIESGEWPGYPDTVETITLPDWRMRQAEFEEG